MYSKVMEKVGCIEFDGKLLDVYSSLDEPLFCVYDIAHLIGVDSSTLLEKCENDEVANLLSNITLVNENGLYNLLAQSYTDTARKWRRIITNELINLRRARSMNILQQFDMWDDMLDDLYIDEETGILMQSVTVEGGDVMQVPYEGK